MYTQNIIDCNKSYSMKSEKNYIFSGLGIVAANDNYKQVIIVFFLIRM